MVGEDRVTMSGKELRRVHVIRQVLEHRLTQKEASTLLGVTDRQIRRLTRRVEQEGDHGLVHRARGRPSNRRISEGRKTTILQLYETRYGDFGPTLASEQLTERHRLPLSAETLRRWLRARGIEHFSRRKRPHRAWRARKAHVGELVQVDGHTMTGSKDAVHGVSCWHTSMMPAVGSSRGSIPMKARFRRWTAFSATCGAMDCHWHSIRIGIPPISHPPRRRSRNSSPAWNRRVSLGAPSTSWEWSGSLKRSKIGWSKSSAWQRLRPSRQRTTFSTTICPGIIDALRSRPPSRPICIGRVRPAADWIASSASRPRGFCGAIGRWPTTGTSIRCRPMCVRGRWSWKTGWMGRCA